LSLKPGSQINESDLEKRLSIGRTPLREAVLRLVNERLITSVPGPGFFICEVTLENVRALFEAAMILELGVMTLALRRISQRDITQMEEINRSLQSAMSKRKSLQITLLNSQFHQIIHQASRNDFLIASLDNYESQYRRLAYFCFSKIAETNDLKDHFDKVIADHKQLIECLKNSDAQGAFNIITGHIRLFHSRVAKYLLPSMQTIDDFRCEYLKSA
jgi:DNA-binding GntR family transcriptional regulator